MSIQMMLLGVGAVATKTYVDDVFSANLYIGNGANSRTITTGIDLDTDGGLTWLRDRQGNVGQMLFDTARGARKPLTTSSTAGQSSYPSGHSLTGWTTTGFTLGQNHNTENWNGYEYVNWNFKKTPGFFTIKEYSGSNSAQTLSHDLGCVPGLILVKRTDSTGDWMVYHRSRGAGEYGKLNTTVAFGAGSGIWNSTSPTSTTFSVEGNNTFVNQSGGTFIAYLFAGGESTNSSARSVSFSSNSNYLNIADSNDFDFGTTFTFEAWVKPDYTGQNLNTIYSQGNFEIAVTDTGRLNVDPNHIFFGGDFFSSEGKVPEGQWTHIAVVVTSGVPKIYVNGVNNQNAQRTGVNVTGKTDAVKIARSGSYYFKGEISNLRAVKGTAVYASSFRRPTEPLTNITNTVLLCCNSSSVTGATVAPNTITTTGSPTASTDSPFDDPAGHVFGESGSENAIKCGSYVGSGGSSGSPEINLGFEPQWLLVKNASSGSTNWYIVDTMRGFGPHNTNEKILKANSNAAEDNGDPYAITSTGWSLYDSADDVNKDGDTYIYMAIRRPDGYVGKPPELGNQVFTPVYGSANAPLFKATNHVVDFSLQKNSNFATQAVNWNATSRLTSGKLLQPNTTAAETSNTYQVFDYQSGTSSYTGGSGIRFGWLWKRHAGFDVVTYDGTGSSQNLSHGLGKSVEMGWIKCRSNGSTNWSVWHKDIPDKYILLNSTNQAQLAGATRSVSSTQYEAFNWNDEGASGRTYIAMLFASVDGISKVGYYDGSSSVQTITTGFQPRFVFVKRANGVASWSAFDSIRGWTGNVDGDYMLSFDNDGAQMDTNFGSILSTGFTVKVATDWNEANSKYIYYAHA